MDIESSNALPSEDSNVQKMIAAITKGDVGSRQLNLMLNGIKDKRAYYEQIVFQYSKCSEYGLKAKILEFLCGQTVDMMQNEVNLDKLSEWMINQIYQIRFHLEQIFLNDDSRLSTLNSLLKILQLFIKTIVGAARGSMNDTTFFIKTITFIVEKTQNSMYELLPNHLFTIHLMLKIIELYSNILPEDLTKRINNILSSSNAIFADPPLISQPILETIYVNTFIKLVRKWYELSNHAQNMIKKVGLNNKLVLVYHLNINNFQQKLNNLYCSAEQELALASKILEKYFVSASNTERQQICNWWINNCLNLEIIEVKIDLKSYLDDFESELLMKIYFKLSERLTTSVNSEPNYRYYLLKIWKAVMMDIRMNSLMQKFKEIFINCELILYQFLRELLEILPCTLQVEEKRIVIEIYIKHSSAMLQQSECDELTEGLAFYIIKEYPDLLDEHFLLKKGISLTNRYSFVVIENYRPEYLNQISLLFKSVGLSRIMSILSKDVGIIFLKYLTINNIVPLMELLKKDEIVEYMISNNIQLHADKYEYILEQKFSNNLVKFIKLINRSEESNMYEERLNWHLYLLLINEGSRARGLKFLDVTNTTVEYLIKHAEKCLQMVIKNEQSVEKFIESLYYFFIRALYFHIPDLLYLLLLVIDNIKRQNNIRIQIEGKVFSELIKFCKMYNNHKSYSLIGLASILYLLYGSPLQPDDYLSQNLEVINELSNQNYLIPKINEILSNQKMLNDKHFSFQKQNTLRDELYSDLMVALRKNLTFGVVYHIRNTLNRKGEQSLSGLTYLYRLLGDYVMIEAKSEMNRRMQDQNIIESFSVRKRTLQDMEDNQSQLTIREKKRPIKYEMKCKPINTSLIDLLNQYKQYDQLVHYNHLKRDLSYCLAPNGNERVNNLNLERVHGKVRNIIHLKKS